MTKKVLITVIGYQNSPDTGEDTIELIAPGEYYKKGGKHYLLYEEAMDETDNLTKNLVKFTSGYLEVTKKGQANAHMLFLDGKETQTYYQTPLGEILMSFSTGKVLIEESDELITVSAVYTMYVNCQPTADCRLTMQIKAVS